MRKVYLLLLFSIVYTQALASEFKEKLKEPLIFSDQNSNSSSIILSVKSLLEEVRTEKEEQALATIWKNKALEGLTVFCIAFQDKKNALRGKKTDNVSA